MSDLLTRHELAELRDTAVLATSELVATAYRLTPDRETLLRIRWQFDALRIVLYGQHLCHGTPERAEECRARRSAEMSPPCAAIEADDRPYPRADRHRRLEDLGVAPPQNRTATTPHSHRPHTPDPVPRPRTTRPAPHMPARTSSAVVSRSSPSSSSQRVIPSDSRNGTS